MYIYVCVCVCAHGVILINILVPQLGPQTKISGFAHVQYYKSYLFICFERERERERERESNNKQYSHRNTSFDLALNFVGQAAKVLLLDSTKYITKTRFILLHEFRLRRMRFIHSFTSIWIFWSRIWYFKEVGRNKGILESDKFTSIEFYFLGCLM